MTKRTTAHRQIGVALTLLTLSTGVGPLSAQDRGASRGTMPEVGDRVRVTAPTLGLRRATGRVEGIRADTLFIQGIGPVPAGAVRSLSVSEGRSPAGRAARKGALIGAVIGAVARPERWHPARLPTGGASLAPPGGGGVRLGLSLSF